MILKRFARLRIPRISKENYFFIFFFFVFCLSLLAGGWKSPASIPLSVSNIFPLLNAINLLIKFSYGNGIFRHKQNPYAFNNWIFYRLFFVVHFQDFNYKIIRGKKNFLFPEIIRKIFQRENLICSIKRISTILWPVY